jgi:iron(III) transport system ATP-binding protein
MNVSLQHLTKKLGDTVAVNDVTLTIADGELFSLLGPSGCGKTTLLRLVAGFYPPDSGEIRFGERRINDVPPNKRNAGMVFQSYALWPHMTVFENVAYGLDVRAVSADEKKRRVLEALEVIRMTDYAGRSTNQLSGGQQQRVALARALVIKPDVLLLDEPLSNLDAQLRLELREEIRRIHNELRLTSIYVTHDQQEALSLADHVAVMRAGCVEQVGTPQELYRAPRNKFVAGFLGEANFIEGTVIEIPDADHVAITTGAGRFVCRGNGQVMSVGQKVTCVIRPHDVIVLKD